MTRRHGEISLTPMVTVNRKAPVRIKCRKADQSQGRGRNTTGDAILSVRCIPFLQGLLTFPNPASSLTSPVFYYTFLCFLSRSPFYPQSTMKVMCAAVLGMVAGTHAFQAPVTPWTSTSGRASNARASLALNAMTALSEEEVG